MTKAHGGLGILEEKEVPVSMRDGVILRANVFRPDAAGTFPGLLVRTPYGKATGGFERFVRAGYVVATQDARGRYASDGEYVPFTVEDTGDAEDGYDTVEWLAKQAYCNGDVGTMGASYNAWMQWMLAKLRPPHLLAMCAYSIPLELTEVDWCGAFRPGRRVRWWMASIAPDLRRRQGLPGPHTKEEAAKIWDEIEHGRWLGFMPWLDLPRYLPKGLAEYAEDWLRHPNRRAWKFAEAHKRIEVPNLDFSGWYDHCNGTMGHLDGMQKNARTDVARKQTKLILGPWNHGGLGKRKIGEIDFGPQAELDLPDLIIRWFDHWLKGLDNGVDREPPVRYFVMGSAKWKRATRWPPDGMREAFYYLASEGCAAQVEGDGCLTTEPSEEAPDGPALEVCYGMVRARHRNSLDREELLTPGEVTEFRIKLGATACRFLKGHRIRLEITSSDFPNHDRNHNTGHNDLADAKCETAQQKIFHSAEHPSRLVLRVDADT